MRRAYRRPIAKADIDGPMAFYREGRAGKDFDAGIARALSAVLINPEFLFRVESEPKNIPTGGVYRISDLELASRLSFFLWSSIPDDELLDAAIAGKLSRPEELEKQTRRMLADRRSFNFATNFAGQWLRLRNLEAVSPNSTIPWPCLCSSASFTVRIVRGVSPSSVRRSRCSPFPFCATLKPFDSPARPDVVGLRRSATKQA